MALHKITTTQMSVLHHAAGRRLYTLPVCISFKNVYISSHDVSLAMATRLCSTEPAAAGRAVGCSDLYNMTEAINAQTAASSTASSLINESSTKNCSNMAAQATRTQARQAEGPSSSDSQGSSSSNNAAGYSSSYYAGLLTTDLQVDNNASGTDMLKRSLQLAGGAAGILCLLTVAFLRANHLI